MLHATAEPHLLPTSFGAFKPVGWLMLGLPTQAMADALAKTLQAASWPGDEVQHFRSSDSSAALQAMAENAGPLAGFGYEITLLRRYVALAQQGWRWLLVKVDSHEQAEAAAALARSGGATLAVHYRALTVEELI